MTATAGGQYILGPLTTTFTPTALCTVPIVDCAYETATCTGWLGQDCVSQSTGLGPMDKPSCWPPVTPAAPSPTSGALAGWGVYSPGLVCPDGYTSACSTTAGGDGNFQFQFPVTAGETAVGCCPSGFFCLQNNPQTCVHTITSTSYRGYECTSDIEGYGEYLIPIFTYVWPATGTTSVTIKAHVLFAPLFQLNWQSSDRPGVATQAGDTTHSMSTSPVTSHSQTSGTTPANSQTQPSATSSIASQTSSISGGGSGGGAAGDSGSGSGSSTNTDRGLSTGAKAGIGAGVGVVGLLLLAAAVWFWRKKRRGRGQAPAPATDEPAELPGDDKHLSEMGGPERYSELPATEAVPINQQHWELPAEDVARS